MSKTIHWHEGLFLQPHHLQQFQKQIHDRFGAERRLSMSYPYGVVLSKLSLDELEDHRVRFEQLHVVMPSGAHFLFPDAAELPSLDVKRVFTSQSEPFTLYLGVPLWLAERANSVEFRERTVSQRVKILYQVDEAELADENTGQNKQPVQTRRLNGLLLFEDEDMSDLEFIPLLRVTRELVSDVSSGPRQDPHYVAPTLILKGSPILRELARDLTSQICATQEELANQLASTPLNLQSLQGPQFEQLWRLRVLSRFSARLPALVDLGMIPPFELYLELRDLLAELASLHPERRDFEVLAYDHDDCYPCFQQLSQKIRGYLKASVKPSYRKVDFHSMDGLYIADLKPEIFQGATGNFLGIQTAQDPGTVKRLVEDGDQFKLMPASFGARAVRGISLKEERFPPLELPGRPGLYFYRLMLDQSRRIWEQFVQEPAAIIHFNTSVPTDYQIALYIALPPGS